MDPADPAFASLQCTQQYVTFEQVQSEIQVEPPRLLSFEPNWDITGDDKKDDAVPPNENWTYIWKVPERAGPSPADPSSVMWMYHSHTAETADTYAGLLGAIVISRRGTLQPSGLPEGIDR